MQPDLCNAAELVNEVLRECLAPPTMAAPGTELRHIADLCNAAELVNEVLRECLAPPTMAALRRHRIK